MKALLTLIGLTIFAFANAQTKMNTSIESTIKVYANSGDEQNVKGLSSTLHDSYRLVWYGGKDAPFITDKIMFLSQFEKKEWGGDVRKVKVESIEVFDGINATAKVVMDGNKAEMRSFFTLVKVDGNWKIIGELVNATFK